MKYQFTISNKYFKEVVDWCEDMYGPPRKYWWNHFQYTLSDLSTVDKLQIIGNDIKIATIFEFRREEDASWFALKWGDLPQFNNNNILLPLIRTAIPTIIVNNILSVQPMSDKEAQIHNLRIKYDDPN